MKKIVLWLVFSLATMVPYTTANASCHWWDLVCHARHWISGIAGDLERAAEGLSNALSKIDSHNPDCRVSDALLSDAQQCVRSIKADPKGAINNQQQLQVCTVYVCDILDSLGAGNIPTICEDVSGPGAYVKAAELIDFLSQDAPGLLATAIGKYSECRL